MNERPVIAALGTVDAAGIHGAAGTIARWRELGVEPPGNGRTLRAVFGRADDTFRRLDPVSRALVLACEAAALERALPKELREDTALVVETTVGCLDADLQFAASLSAAMPDAPVFPYTLPSTCLGEVALRWGLRGVSSCLCIAPAQRGAALTEAQRLLASGEARTVLACTVDVLTRVDAPAALQCEVVVALVVDPRLGLPPVAAWPAGGAVSFASLRRYG